MMKRIWLAFVWICGSVVLTHAQVTTNTRILNQAAIDFRIKVQQENAATLAMAKEKGWPLTMVTKNGNIARLSGRDQFGFPRYAIVFNNTTAAATTRANQLWPGGTSGLNLSGSSANMKNKLGLWDDGKSLNTHVELIGRVTQKDNPASFAEHSTHTTGTMIASGVNPVAKGMAYGALGMIAYDYGSSSIMENLPQMATEAPGIVLSNHSYGLNAGWVYNSSQSRWEFYGLPGATEDYSFGYYDTYAQAIDSIVYNAPYYLPVYAAGNPRDQNGPAVGQPYYRYDNNFKMISAGNRPAGISSNDSYDVITSSSTSKNILTVGAVSGIASGYARKEDVVMTSFSAWGPTDDGRIKPDLVADGVDVLSSSAASNTSYAIHSGTSMATPNTTGSLFLLQEYYSKLKSGTFMRAATLKGLAIHTTDEAGNFNGPDYQFGWGLLNVERAASVITAAVPSNNAATSQHQLYENVLNNGQTFTTNVIASGNGALKATISWTDVKGVVQTSNVLNNRTKLLVNDLDIRITTGAGATARTYYPWTLDVNNPSVAAVPGDNITDNVERIDLDSTIPGQTYTITVSHKGTLQRGSQAYSLLISGVGGTAYCASASGGGGARIDSVSFGNIHVANSAGSKTYTNNTAYVADIETLQTMPIAVKVSTNGNTTNPRIVKVFIDINNNGTFEASELLATSGVLTAAAQIYNANLTIPAATVGNISLMRIIVQETSNAGDISACGTYGAGETQDYRVRIKSASNDMMVSDIISPLGGDCANSSGAYLTIRIKNNGAADQSAIPLSATIMNGTTTVATMSAVYPGIVPSLGSVVYTFQTPFVLTAGGTYAISATTKLTGDQNSSNDQKTASVAVAAKASSPIPYGEICGTSAILKIKNAESVNYYWYPTLSSNSPFGSGPNVSTTTIPADKTFYVAKEIKAGSVGPVNKLVYASGGYNTYYNNYVKINNTVPVVIETARLYIGNPGRITFTVGDLSNVDATTGSYYFAPLASVTIDAYATNPNPIPGAVSGNPATDTGAVYYLNLPVNTVGDHAIVIKCDKGLGRSDSASIFRNNGIGGSSTYPTGINGAFNITGNSANTGGSVESQFYYFFYDTRVSTYGCTSDRVSVTLASATAPILTQQGDSLVSSSATTGNQWFLNDTTALSVTTNHYKPTKAGRYKVTATDSLGCVQTSNVVTYVITALADVQADEIKLAVSPNPNNGVFNVSFEVSTKADLTIELLNSAGRKVYTNTTTGFSGKYSKQLSIDGLSSGMYLLRIQHDKKTYVKKVLVQH